MADNGRKCLKRSRQPTEQKAEATRPKLPLESPSPAVSRKSRRRHPSQTSSSTSNQQNQPKNSLDWALEVEKESANQQKETFCNNRSPSFATTPNGGGRKQQAPNRKDSRPKFLRALALGDFVPKDQQISSNHRSPTKSGSAPFKGDQETPPQLRRSPRKRCQVDNYFGGKIGGGKLVEDFGGQSPSKRLRCGSVGGEKREEEEKEKGKSGKEATPSNQPPISSMLHTPERQQLSRPSTPNSTCSGTTGSVTASGRVRPPIKYPLPEGWCEPTLGWLKSKDVLQRREKDLSKGYDSPVYRKYVKEVPKSLRTKNLHPRTPNKYINYPRRSWDSQVRQWRRALHVWAGESESNCPSSLNTSFSSESNVEDNPSQNSSPVKNEGEKKKEGGRGGKSEERESAVKKLADPNDLASLLGHYDIDSRKAFNEATVQMKMTVKDDGESTLKATQPETAGGPTDFSALTS